MPLIRVFGIASQKLILEIKLNLCDLELNLLELLQLHHLPIASSCQGQGVCKKCIFNQNKLLCEFKVKDYIKDNQQIEILYL